MVFLCQRKLAFGLSWNGRIVLSVGSLVICLVVEDFIFASHSLVAYEVYMVFLCLAVCNVAMAMPQVYRAGW